MNKRIKNIIKKKGPKLDTKLNEVKWWTKLEKNQVKEKKIVIKNKD